MTQITVRSAANRSHEFAPPGIVADPGPTGVFASNATLIRRIDLTPSIARFVVRRDGVATHHVAGQYLALGIWADGRPLQRPYSTASPPTTFDELDFLIRRVPHGALTPRLWALPAGARLRVGQPKGLFTLDPRHERTALFVATGTGLAPIISMLAALLDGPSEARPPRMIVLHGVSYSAELAYRERLEDWAATHSELVYEPAISRPSDPLNAGWGGAVGHVDAMLDAAWQRHRLQPEGTVVYLCGNPEVIAAGARILIARGVRPDAIVAERYWTSRTTGPSALDRPS